MSDPSLLFYLLNSTLGRKSSTWGHNCSSVENNFYFAISPFFILYFFQSIKMFINTYLIYCSIKCIVYKKQLLIRIHFFMHLEKYNYACTVIYFYG